MCVFHLLYTYSKDVIFALKSEVLSIQCKADRREAPNFRTINSILRRKNHNAYLSIEYSFKILKKFLFLNIIYSFTNKEKRLGKQLLFISLPQYHNINGSVLLPLQQRKAWPRSWRWETWFLWRDQPAERCQCQRWLYSPRSSTWMPCHWPSLWNRIINFYTSSNELAMIIIKFQHWNYE